MAKCNIPIDFTGTPEALVEKAKAAIGKAGGDFEGDTGSGSFRLSTPLGGIAGNYTITGATMHIKIEDKPMFVGCGMIEEKLREYLTR